jgi:hypothetical protein
MPYQQIFNSIPASEYRSFLAANVDIVHSALKMPPYYAGKNCKSRSNRLDWLFIDKGAWTDIDYEFEDRLWSSWFRFRTIPVSAVTDQLRSIADSARVLYWFFRCRLSRIRLNDTMYIYIPFDNSRRAEFEFKGRELMEYSLSRNDAVRITALLDSLPVDLTEVDTTKENAEIEYRKIGMAENRETGDDVQFVNASFGKIERHRDYDPRLIGRLGYLFRNSVFLFDEKPDYDTPRTDGTLHKQKSNVGSFSNYCIKVSIDNIDYLVRYSIQNMKDRNGRITDRQFHSQQLSPIKISNLPMTSPSSMGAGRSVASDYKLASFLEIVKIRTEEIRHNRAKSDNN